MAKELPESQDLRVELVHQPAQFYHQENRWEARWAGSPRIQLLNCTGSTSLPRPHTAMSLCASVVRRGGGNGMLGQKGSLQDPSAHPSRFQGRNKVLRDADCSQVKTFPTVPSRIRGNITQRQFSGWCPPLQSCWLPNAWAALGGRSHHLEWKGIIPFWWECSRGGCHQIFPGFHSVSDPSWLDSPR